MSYYASSKETSALILAKNVPLLIEAFNKEYEENGLFAKTIDDVFEDTGFIPEPSTHYEPEAKRYTSGGDYSFYFEYNPWHQGEAEEFLHLIAPFVEKGSYISFISEDDCLWAYYFDGQDVTEYNGEVCFPGMPGEVSYRGLSEHESVMTNLETIFGKELAGSLPQDFIDRIQAADRGSVLKAIAEILFDAVVTHAPQPKPIPSGVLANLVTGGDDA